MGKESEISWTHATFNPWWGCLKVSEGCQHCYADTLAHRYGFDVWGPAKTTERRMMSENYWKQPLKWNRDAEKAGERKRVFCASMADVFEDHPGVVEARARLFDLIGSTIHLDWLLLTKRPENITRMLPELWGGNTLINMWLGTSVENQEQANKRIPELLKVPARVRFLSCEPLLSAVDLTHIACPNGCEAPHYCNRCYPDGRKATGTFDAISDGEISWVICGGESGPGARPMHPQWARSLRDQCQSAGVAFHFKQWGEYTPYYEQAVPETGDLHLVEYSKGMKRVGKHAAGRILDGVTWDEFPACEASGAVQNTAPDVALADGLRALG